MGVKLLQHERGMTFTIGLDSLEAIHMTRREAMILGKDLINALHRKIEGVHSSQIEKRVFK